MSHKKQYMSVLVFLNAMGEDIRTKYMSKVGNFIIKLYATG